MSIKMNREEIQKIIPQSDPILLADEVVEMIPEKSIVTRFYVDPKMDVLRGHFPNEPVYPGVYTVEGMAQAVCILLLSIERYKNKTPLFLGIDKMRFVKKVTPGDTLEISATVISERQEKALAICAAEATVNGEVVASGEVTLAIR